MTDNSATLAQHNPRPKLQGRTLSNWTWPDRILLVLIFASAVLAFIFVGPIGGLLCTGMLIFLYRSSKGYGRLYVDLRSDMKSSFLNDFHKGIIWRADDTEGPWLARWLRKRRTAIPSQFIRIKAEIDENVESFCLFHQTDRPLDHFYVLADAGAFADADVNQQTRLVAEMNELLDGIVSQSDLKAGISHLRINGPFNQMTVANNFAAAIDPIIARPERFILDDATTGWVNWARENGRQIPLVLEQYQAAELWSLIVITIKRRRKWSKAKSQQVAEVPIVELGHALIEGLRDASNLKLQNVHSPGLAEMALIARSSWDVVTISDYFRKRNNGEIPRNDAEIDAILNAYMAEAEAKAAKVKSKRKQKAIRAEGALKGAEEVDRLLAAWPQKCIETDKKGNYLRFDDNYIAILRTTELPKQFRSDKIMSLHWRVKNRWTRFAFVGESISGDAEATMLIYKASALENFFRFRSGRHIIRDPRKTNKSREISNQLEQMAVSTIAQMANGLIVIVERNPKRLRRAIKEVQAKFKGIDFKTEQVKGTARLLDYFLTGALAANRA